MTETSWMCSLLRDLVFVGSEELPWLLEPGCFFPPSKEHTSKKPLVAHKALAPWFSAHAVHLPSGHTPAPPLLILSAMMAS